ncbi:MAG: SET domain-containing protein-lysine N-methyltransferase [Verrucomicrobiae bacterium]|nr:SET domain-containing protein-lysine N-methyltransferase [Verrucomicrobiae bacterium]
MDHQHASVRAHPRFGHGVFASAPIRAGEEIASFDGQIYIGLVNADFSEEIRNYPITFAQDRARDSLGIARKLNHSCDPNVGIRGLFTLVAMRDIESGEELCWDYDMSEDTDWNMPCDCGSPRCRKRIRGFRHLPRDFRDRYRGFISDWLVEKYGLNDPEPAAKAG